MRLTLHTLICCCVLVIVLQVMKGATGEVNLRKRFREWLQGQIKRDAGNGIIAAKDQSSDKKTGQGQDESGQGLVPPFRSGLHSRLRRSSSPKPSGCALVTCIYHDLIYIVHSLKNLKLQAPEDKMGSKGYGRRRRSLLDISQLAIQIERQSQACQQVLSNTSICSMV